MEKVTYGEIVDIHCHLLPNVDDGPSTWEESLEMATIAYQDGIKLSVTTPHFIQGTRWELDPIEIKDKVEELNQELRANEIPLTVLPGMEIGISENLLGLLSAGRVLTLVESNFILLEIPFISLPYGIEEIIFNLKTMGFSPILAHPERNKEIQNSPSQVLKLVSAGAFIQVTAGSACGYFGDSAKRCIIELAKQGMIHAVASDAHNPHERPPLVTKGLKVLEEITSAEEIKILVNNADKFIRRQSESDKL